MRAEERKQSYGLSAAPYVVAWCALLMRADAGHTGPPGTGPGLSEVRLRHERRSSLAVSPDGRLLVSGDARGAMRAWDVKTAKLLWQTPGVGHAVTRLAFVDGGGTLAARHSREDRPILLWDAETGRRHSSAGKRPVDANAATLLGLAPGSGVLALWLGDVVAFSSESWRSPRQRQPGKIVESAALSPDGRTLAITDVEHVRLWEMATGELRLTIDISPAMLTDSQPVVFSADGRTLYIAARGKSIQAWDLATGKSLRPFKSSVFSYGVELSPDGRTLLAAYADGVRLWDINTREVLRHWESEVVRSLAFSPDGNVAVLGGYDEILLVRGIKTLTRARQAAPVPAAPAQKRTSKELARLWTALDGHDPASAYVAVWALASSGDEVLAGLRQRLKPVPRLTEERKQRLARLIRDLDSERFAVRQKASEELAGWHDLARPALEQVLRERPPLEVRYRAEQLLEKLDQTVLSPQRARLLRALEVLEHSRNPATRKLLEDLANGAPEAWLTSVAQEVLRRRKR